MKRHYLSCFFIFYCTMGILHAQPAPDQLAFSTMDADSAAWEMARQSIVLLRNTGELLPLQHLDKRRIDCRLHGIGAKTVFEQTMEWYCPILPKTNSPETKAVLLVVVNSDSSFQDSAYFEGLAYRARLESETKAIVVVVFGNPSPIKNAPTLLEIADVLLLVPEADSLNQLLAAQVLFGGCAANGRLQTDLPPFFKQNDGLTTQATRLGYAPPALVGLDAQLLADSIRAIVEAGIRAKAFPGAQVLVAKDGMVVFHETYGFHTYDSLQAVRPDDLYDFASVTKVTSTLPALMRLYGEGKFDLDAPLRRYLPFFKKSDKAAVTYRQFLAHHGRLKPSIVFWQQAKDEYGHWKKRSFRSKESRRYSIQITDSLFLFKNYKKQIYKGIRDLPLSEKTGYVYSDLSFILYPLVVERLTGEPLEQYLKATFYQPLGAATLTYNPLRFFPKARIVPTERDTFFRKIQLQGTVHDETAAMLGGVSGHAGLFGSAGDLAKLVQLYLNGGEYGGERFMGEAAVREFTRCQYCAESNRRGIGFDKPLIEYDPQKSYVARSASAASFGHSGYTGTFFWADPDHNLMVIFLSNRVYPDRSHTGISDLNIRPRVQQVVYDALK